MAAGWGEVGELVVDYWVVVDYRVVDYWVVD